MLVRLLLMWLALTLTACASMRWSDYHKRVMISSQPQGARVYYLGQEVGRTPMFLTVRRQKEISYTLIDAKGAAHLFDGSDGLRWTDSLISGAIFGTIAPVAWGIDWWTGTLWDPKAQNNLVLESNAPADPVSTVAIVPLDYDDPLLSEAVARSIAEKVKERYPSAKIIPYDKTSYKFEAWGYTWSTRPQDERFNLMVEDLNVSHIVVSRLEEMKSDTLIHLKLMDVHSNEEHVLGDLSLNEDKIPVLRKSKLERFFDRYVAFVPNTFAVRVASDDISFRRANEAEIEGKTKSSDDIFGQASQFLGAVSLSRKRGPALPESQRLTLRWYPDVGLSLKKINFAKDSIQRDIEYDRFKTYLGFGPQVEWEGRLGVLYFTYKLFGQFTRVRVAGEKFDETELNSSLGFGYYRFITPRWVLQIFIESQNESKSAWEKAMSHATGSHQPLEKIDSYSGGISLGYYFPEVKKWGF